MNKQKETFAEKQPLLTFAKSGRCRIAIYIGEETETVSNRIGEEDETTEERTVYAYNVGWLTPEKGVKITNEEEALAAIKADLIAQITAYDTSSAVKSFSYGAKTDWFLKEKRVGLVNSITIEKNAGKEMTTLWLSGEKYELPVDTALQMLAALELYSLECYNVTEEHKAAVRALENVEDIIAYDYTANYPSKLIF